MPKWSLSGESTSIMSLSRVSMLDPSLLDPTPFESALLDSSLLSPPIFGEPDVSGMRPVFLICSNLYVGRGVITLKTGA